MASVLKVDTLRDTSGNAHSFGKVVQIVDVYNTDYISQSFSANSRGNMTNMNATITPASSTSKVLIQVRWLGEFSWNDASWNGTFGLKRGSTIIGNPASTGSTNDVNKGIMGGLLSYHAGDANSTLEYTIFDYLDSPSTTSATTYYTTFGAQSSTTVKSGGVYNWNTGRTTSYERGTYGIRLWEISA